MDNQIAAASHIGGARGIAWILAIALWSIGTSCAEEGKTMESASAFKLVGDWARAERDNTDAIHHQANGDFYGKVATLGFQFDNAAKNLAVRGRVLIDAASLMKYQDILQELNRIARDEPERVSRARFDLVRMPWDTGDQPTLYLRQDYKVADVKEAWLFEQWRKLRETAYLWHRTYYREAVDPVVQRRLKRQ
jgi:hypothetical protein